MSTERQYDVVILGTGLAGTIMGAILARHGHRVIMIEKGSHPRFAIGESVLPKGSLWFRVLADRYGVPELAHFGSAKSICEHVAPTTGQKIVNGFLYHQAGQRQRVDQSHVFIPTPTPLGWDSHLFREDTDHYLLRLAQSYGAAYRDNTAVVGIDIDDHGVSVTCDGGDRVQGRYLIDASGFRSPVAEAMGLREQPTRFRTQSRSVFTHMKNVRYYNQILAEADQPPTAYTWRDGTVQHVFDGGWFWLIPFGNHEYSRNQLCSVGVVLDTKKFPDNGQPAEEEFWSFVNRFSSIAAQFDRAEATRSWIKTGRLQYSSTAGAGDRFFLTSNANGFIDPLHSRGIICTNENIFHFADVLLRALDDGDLSGARFAEVDAQQQRMLDFADRHISNFYTCFESYPLWNAWLRLHVMNEFLGYMALVRRYALHLEHGDVAVFGELDGQPFPSTIYPNFPGLQELYDQCEAYLDGYRSGQHSAEQAAEAIMALLRTSDYLPPMFDWTRPDFNHIDSTTERSKIVAEWGAAGAPQDIRQHVFDFPRSVLQRIGA